MLSERALKVLSDFVFRKAPQGLFEFRTFCACSDYRRLEVKSLEDVVDILNYVFENFGSLIEDWEVENLKSWLRPYGIIIEKRDKYRARVLKSGYEDRLEEIFDYFSCGMKRQALILAKALLEEVLKEREFDNLKDVLTSIYDSLDRDLSEDEALFILKTVRNVVELCSSPQA